MSYAPNSTMSPQRMIAIAVIVLLHIALIIAMKSGLARKVVEIVVPPLKVEIVKDEIIPEKEPPPPAVNIETPPPFVPAPEINIEFPPEPAPTITVTTKPPPEPSQPQRQQPIISSTAPGVIGNSMSKPDYPPVSRRLGQEGTVVLSLYILETGKVGEAKVAKTSGHPKLDQAAVDHALKAWRFKPATQNGKPVPTWYDFRVKFTLDDYQ